MIAASSIDNPISFGASSTIPTISNVAGTKHIITAGLPIFLSPERSRPRPALVRIMISAIFRSSAEIPRILSSNRFSTYGPSVMPVIIIPSRLGSLIFLQIQPIDIPTSRIKAILNNMLISIPPPLAGGTNFF